MNDEMKSLLANLKERTGRDNLSSVIRDALKVYNWVVGEYEKGNEVISHADSEGRRRFSLLSFRKVVESPKS